MSSRFGIIFHGPLFSTPQPIISNKHTHIIIDQGSTKSFNTTRRADQVLEVAAPYIRERTWHPSQSITDNRDGSIVLNLKVADLGEVKRWLISFGAESRVLKPAVLQREIVTECARISRTGK
ncbi:MAG: hypothetical protein DMG96_29295 [Acidobacteria bacterium]|nr:MAG: hypothetical protein DMG96_29295 [Acidobacteriota bacterium]